jgi:hypothetical protein
MGAEKRAKFLEFLDYKIESLYRQEPAYNERPHYNNSRKMPLFLILPPHHFESRIKWTCFVYQNELSEDF